MTFSYLNEYLHENNNGMLWDEALLRRLQDPKCIEKYGFKVYSQNDEDGLIEEIFNRIGMTNKRFIEFGVQDGLESNGHYLLLKEWQGFWIECDHNSVMKIAVNFSNVIKNKKLTVAEEYITRDNINDIFVKYGQTGEIDLLSIDIDGNDYHVWKQIEVVNPRVVVIEYNAKIPPSCEWVMPYCESHMWDGGDKHGASLLALEKLGQEKGYGLVGTNISGVNAFFVRKDCLSDSFAESNARELYNPPRYYKKYYSGHPSLYCIAELPEGRKQLFAGCDSNVLFRGGFHSRESLQNNMHWMSKTEANLWVKAFDYDVTKLKIHLNNPVYFREDIKSPLELAYRVEDGEYISVEINAENITIEMNVEEFERKDDGVISIDLRIDRLWCPREVGMGEDSRNLGLLVLDVECL